MPVVYLTFASSLRRYLRRRDRQKNDAERQDDAECRRHLDAHVCSTESRMVLSPMSGSTLYLYMCEITLTFPHQASPHPGWPEALKMEYIKRLANMYRKKKNAKNLEAIFQGIVLKPTQSRRRRSGVDHNPENNLGNSLLRSRWASWGTLLLPVLMRLGRNSRLSSKWRNAQRFASYSLEL